MASLKQQLRERLGYLDQSTRERVVADLFAALDRPTLLMVDQGARVLGDEHYNVHRRHETRLSDRALVEAVFTRMVDAGRNGA